jgi:hypothetical protein
MVLNKKVTPTDINKLKRLKKTLTDIFRARGTPNQLKIFIQGLVKQIDELLLDENIRDRLITINSLMELIIKFLCILQLIK